MAGNSFGQLFRLTTAGESHGQAMVAIVDGCPPGMELDTTDIQPDLDRRRPGKSRFETQRREQDRVTIVSGTFNGVTTGTPIALTVENTDQRSQDYSDIKDTFRPSHADYSYEHKYGLRDYRGGGRASARETVMRVAAGAIAKKYLRLHLELEITGFLSQIGTIKPAYQIDHLDSALINSNPFFCPDSDAVRTIEEFMTSLKKKKDSIGAQVTVVAQPIPPGLGEPVYSRLDADIANAMMGINAVKGVAVGDGFAAVHQYGSEHRDEMSPTGFHSNHSGGIVGGISSGQPIIVHLALKPTSSIALPGKTINRQGESEDITVKGRHDPCVGLRATPIAEAMLALTLMDHLMRHRAQCGAVHSSLPILR